MTQPFPAKSSAVILALAAPLAAQSFNVSYPLVSPPNAVGATMAFDLSTGRSVLFGGEGEGPLGGPFLEPTDEQWEFDGATWTPFTGARPGARSGHGMAYDEVRQDIVLFGGYNGLWVGPTPPPSLAATLGDTWTYSNGVWVERSPATTPPGRHRSPLVWVGATNTAVMFGGEHDTPSGQIQQLNDFWMWDGSDWSQLQPATVPPARSGHQLAYDSVTSSLVLFGGVDGNNTTMGDTWVYDFSIGDWAQVTSFATPVDRFSGAMNYDLQTGKTVLIGGAQLSPQGIQALDDIWSFDSAVGSWTQESTQAFPGLGVAFGASTYDRFLLRTVLVQGVHHGGDQNGATAIYDSVGSQSGATAVMYGAGCVGSAGQPTLAPAPNSVPAIGSVFRADITELPANSIAVLGAGLSDQSWGGVALPFPLVPGCDVLADVAATLTLTADALGEASWSLAVPAQPSLAGFTMYAQALSLDAVATYGLATSNGLRLTVQ